MPTKKSRKTTRKTKARKTSSRSKHHSHVLYGCLAVIGGVVVGMILFGLIMK